MHKDNRLAHSQPASEGLREALERTRQRLLDLAWEENASIIEDLDAALALQPLTEPQRGGREGEEGGTGGLRLASGSPTMLQDEFERWTNEQLAADPVGHLAGALLVGIRLQDGFVMDVRKLAEHALAAIPALSTPAQAEPVALWPVGTLVRKRSGGQWHGRVCGYYVTDLTAEGYAVESLREPGSVQIYPRKALELWEGDALPLLGAEERKEGE